MKQYIECGKIVTTHGLTGELKIQPWCDTPEFLLGFEKFYIDAGEGSLEVASCRIHKGMALIKFVGFLSLELAQTVRNKILYIDRADDTLEEGDYYIQDLIGMEVIDTDTKALYGRLTEVSETGANQVYHILFADKTERLVPAIPQVIISIDLAQNKMEIRPLEGLFDDEN